MARTSAPAREKRSSPPQNRGSRIARVLGWALAFLVFFPMIEVLAVRYFDPGYTPLMLIRRVQGRRHAGPTPVPAQRWVRVENVSPLFLKAVWQTEDARFFTHKGFDWMEVDRAMIDARRRGKPARGASTITMQCARSLFLWQGRSWVRKPLEAYYTILMEKMLTKRRIFELYVNVIETGDGLYGIEAASQHYWHIPSSKLNASQAALITATLPNPRERTPLHPTARVQRYVNHVLRNLRQSPRWPL